MFLSPSIIFLVAVLVPALIYLYHCYTSPLWNVPGPILSRFTSLILRWHEFQANRTMYIHSLHLKYGSTVRIAPNEMSFTSYEAVKEIYGSSGSGYDKHEFYNLFRIWGRKTMFSTLDKSAHSKRKRILADRYSNSNVIKTASLGGIESLAQEFTRQCENASQKGVDIYVKLHSFACDGVTHHIFHPYGSHSLQNDADREMMHQVTTDNSLGSRLVQLHYPKLYQYLSKIIDLFFEPLTNPLADEFVGTRARLNDPAEFTLLSRLRQKAGSELDDEDIATECMDHMVAGIDTTGDVLCFLMWELSQPHSLRFQKELQHELLTNPEKPFDKLPFLDAIIQEGLRCFPAIPMSLPRVVPPGGKTIAGYSIPASTIVSSQAYSVQRHNTEVFPEPDAYNPHRWTSPTADPEMKRLIFAFSHGGRGCVGKHLALAEMKLLLRNVYSRFTTLPDPETTPQSMRSHDQIISARPYSQKCMLRFIPIAEE